MTTTWLVSDTHFGHEGVCKFLAKDGVSKLRPFNHPDEMDEFMVAAWNAKVKPNDKVYHLGDVVMRKQALQIMHRLNGDKVLIKGNHDIFSLDVYAAHFRDIRAVHKLDGIVLTHIPLHVESLGRYGVNVHGHLHDREVMVSPHHVDSRYLCVCVEQTEFAPISLEEVRTRIKNRNPTAAMAKR